LLNLGKGLFSYFCPEEGVDLSKRNHAHAGCMNESHADTHGEGMKFGIIFKP